MKSHLILKEVNMKVTLSFSLIVSLVLAGASFAAADSGRFVEQFKLTGGQIVMIAEGETEPKSIGSYSVRIYSGAIPEFPTDDFITGIILPRDGVVDKVLLEDINGDDLVEIIVTQRSVGSGGYLAVDAIEYKDKTLRLMVSLNGLDPRSEPVVKLKEEIQ